MHEFIEAGLSAWNFAEIDFIGQLLVFLERGGNVVVIILVAAFTLWMLILERYVYFARHHKQLLQRTISSWNQRNDRNSWYAHKIRQRWLSIARVKAEKNLSTLKAVIVIAPLLGLLGTVTGMIDVFEVMSFSSASNTRAMAAGVSKATIPTMAGMVVSLVGLLFEVGLRRRATSSIESLANQLLVEDTSARSVEHK